MSLDSTVKYVAPLFKYVDNRIIVFLEGYEIPFGEYEYEYGMPESSVLLSCRNEYGGVDDTSSVYLAAPGIVIYSRVCEDHREASLHENVVDVPGLVLDLVGRMYVSWLAVQAYGPLFNGDCSLAHPLLLMSYDTTAPYADGNNGEEIAGLYWGDLSHVHSEVLDEFRRRTNEGAYPEITELIDVGSTEWRTWVIGLLTSVPLRNGAAEPGCPLVSDVEVLNSLSTEDLLNKATEILLQFNSEKVLP